MRKSEGTWDNQVCVVVVFMCIHIFTKINCAFSGYILFCELDFSKMYLKRRMFDSLKLW